MHAVEYFFYGFAMHTEWREMNTRHIPKYLIIFFFITSFPLPTTVEQLDVRSGRLIVSSRPIGPSRKFGTNQRGVAVHI